MTTTELSKLFDDITKALELNRSVMTPDFFQQIDKIMQKIKEPNAKAAICAFFDIQPNDLDNMFENVEKFMNTEIDFLDRGVDTQIINILNKTKKRSLIMNAIAFLV